MHPVQDADVAAVQLVRSANAVAVAVAVVPVLVLVKSAATAVIARSEDDPHHATKIRRDRGGSVREAAVETANVAGVTEAEAVVGIVERGQGVEF